jgi:hypothetical protein
MAVDWVMAANWGVFSDSGSENNYWRIPFAGTPHILATSYLGELSPGARDGVEGVAVSAFKRFEFLDGGGLVQETELTGVATFIEVVNCVSITVALDLTDATVLGGWSFYWLR